MAEEEYLTRREAELLLEAHEDKHLAENKAIETALAAVADTNRIHAEAHRTEHMLAQQAIVKAEQAADRRFAQANGYREAFEVRLQQAATKESVEVTRQEIERRFEDFRHQIDALEKTDISQAGRGQGIHSYTSTIVTIIGLVGSILAIVIILSNVLTSHP